MWPLWGLESTLGSKMPDNVSLQEAEVVYQLLCTEVVP